jgi:flagellar hook-basal body complex protein FliE
MLSAISAIAEVAGNAASDAVKVHSPGKGFDAFTSVRTDPAGKTPFGALLTDAVGEIGQLESQAHVAVDGLITGSGVDVHQAMIATEKASMAFELALAVRNKAVQAYQSVMAMQF